MTKGADLYLTNRNEHSPVVVDPRFVADDEPDGYEGVITIEVEGGDAEGGGTYRVKLDGFEMVYPVEVGEPVAYGSGTGRLEMAVPVACCSLTRLIN